VKFAAIGPDRTLAKQRARVDPEIPSRPQQKAIRFRMSRNTPLGSLLLGTSNLPRNIAGIADTDCRWSVIIGSRTAGTSRRRHAQEPSAINGDILQFAETIPALTCAVGIARPPTPSPPHHTRPVPLRHKKAADRWGR
jgi:hypothetical protein